MWTKSSFCESGACLEWTKSSFCETGACLEVGTTWTKSSKSAANGNSAEAARPRVNEILVRDSKSPNLALSFTAEEWRAFVEGVKAGEFDLD
jgi:Domain of unknown function (DUF397)